MKSEKQAKRVSDELIDEWLEQGRKPEDVHGLLKQLTKKVLERDMRGEMTEHLGYAKHDPAGNNSGNSRNGVMRKSLMGDFGEIELETPRDRNGEFEPRIIKKNQTRWTGTLAARARLRFTFITSLKPRHAIMVARSR